MATSSGVSGLLEMRDSMIGNGRRTLDASSLPLSISSETAFTSFYGSQLNLKASRSSMPRVSSNSHLNTSGGMSSIRLTWCSPGFSYKGKHQNFNDNMIRSKWGSTYYWEGKSNSQIIQVLIYHSRIYQRFK